MERLLTEINPYTGQPHTEEDIDAIVLILAAGAFLLQGEALAGEAESVFHDCDDYWRLIVSVGGAARLRDAIARYADQHTVGNPFGPEFVDDDDEEGGGEPSVPETPA